MKNNHKIQPIITKNNCQAMIFGLLNNYSTYCKILVNSTTKEHSQRPIASEYWEKGPLTLQSILVSGYILIYFAKARTFYSIEVKT